MPGVQAEALGKQIRFFHRKSRVVFQSSFCLCGALGVVACQELSSCMVLCSSGKPTFLGIRARQSRDVSCVDCVCLLALARQLESVVGGADSQASERQQKNVCDYP